MKKENSTLSKKLAQYSAMVAPALALASISNAQVVYTDIDPDFVLTDSTSADTYGPVVVLDLNNDGANDVEFVVWSQIPITNGNVVNLAVARQYGNSGNGVLGYTNTLTATTGATVKFAYGSALNNNEVIGSGGNFWSLAATNSFGTLAWYYVVGNSNGTYGQWNNVNDKFLGVRFLSSGSIHYGWVRMDVADNPASITLKDFAFESQSDVEIKAGDTGNIGIGDINNNSNINMVAFEKEVFIAVHDVTGNQMTIAVRDMLGKTLISQTTKENSVRMNLNNLSNGLYLVTANKGGVEKTIKVSIR